MKKIWLVAIGVGGVAGVVGLVGCRSESTATPQECQCRPEQPADRHLGHRRG